MHGQQQPPNSARITSAIDAATAACRETDLELRVPPEFVVDVLLNSTCCPQTVRPAYLQWARGMIARLPNLGPDQRETLLRLSEISNL